MAQIAPSFLHFGEIRVEPPPGAFLQASAAGEAAIVQAVLDGLPPKLTSRSRIVELYAGCGTLSFPMSDHAQVLAYEGDAASLASLARAAGGRRIQAIKRDLARQPLQKPELAAASAIVLDPPYPGAASQMGPIAASGVRRVIYVSCNPAALTRDAATLRQAGYVLDRAVPVDQFLWSAQLETVCVFSRA